MSDMSGGDPMGQDGPVNITRHTSDTHLIVDQPNHQNDGTSEFSSEVPECVRKTCYEYRGVIMPNFMPTRCMRKLEHFETRPDDLFVISYPKSGTTWIQQLALLIRFDGNLSLLADQHIMTLVPFLDSVDFLNLTNVDTAATYIDMAASMPSPRIMKSHSLLNWLPPDIRSHDPKVKVIYVARNPKDVAVSYFHFCHYSPLLPSYDSWDTFFEEYIEGRAPQGSWFENVLPWWKRRNHPNVLFLKYEDMKKDLHTAVVQIMQFMGKSLPSDVIDQIVAASTFDAMKKSPSSNPDLQAGRTIERGSFMRKGAVADWKNYFSDEQSCRFDELYKKELAESGLDFDFSL
ncbi:sulfotransferase 1C2-like [Diadema antillarum]|uniref:sulfotransferase 1C2-like n=1 Tax=Diadema antillarum TaxID=105358 RepID=UPI003A8B7404